MMERKASADGLKVIRNKGLAGAAEVAARDVLGVKEGDRALIVTNPESDVYSISLAMYDAVQGLGGRPVLMVQPVKTQLDFAEPAVIEAIRSNPDICISLSAEKLGKDEGGIRKNYRLGEKEYDHIFDYLYRGRRMRAFWSPSVTAEMFAKTVPIDYALLRRDCTAVKEALDRAVSVHVTSDKGTDLTIGLKGRLAEKDDGDFRVPGTGGNLPAGEVYASPQLGSSEGTIAFDGSISLEKGDLIIREPIIANVKGNFVTTLEGGEEARVLEKTLQAGRDNALAMAREGKLAQDAAAEYARNARNLGELGIGLNRKAGIVGNMLEDEKVYSTCHIAIGSNYDEDAKAMIHLDGLVKLPTIIARCGDGAEIEIMRKGKLML